MQEKSVMITICQHSASLVMRNGDPRGWIFLPYPQTHDRFLCSYVPGPNELVGGMEPNLHRYV